MTTNRALLISTPNRWRQLAASAILGTSIAAGVIGTAAIAHAERVPAPQPNTATSLQIECYNLQQRLYGLVSEYGAAYDSGDEARMEAILNDIRGVGRSWEGACKGTYGSIAKLPPDQMAIQSVQNRPPASGGALSPDHANPPTKAPTAPAAPASSPSVRN